MIELLRDPLPWYVAGPLIGLVVPMLLLIGGKQFGVSANFRHTCAACMPGKVEYFQYNWRREGAWNLIFVLGAVLGGFIGGSLLNNPEPVNLSPQTLNELQQLGVSDFSGLIPTDLFSWTNLASWQGLVIMVAGGFLVGFGARYAGGCTSGHAINGLADLQFGSLLAVIGFFVGGLFITHLVLPFLL